MAAIWTKGENRVLVPHRQALHAHLLRGAEPSKLGHQLKHLVHFRRDIQDRIRLLASVVARANHIR